MKASLLLENLQQKLPFLNQAISARAQLPILANFLIETKKGGLRFFATDLEIGITVSVPASIEKEGRTTVQARQFSEIILGPWNEEKITLEIKDESLWLFGNKSKTSFRTQGAEDFPRLYEEKGQKVGEFKGEDLPRALGKVIFAAAQDGERPVFSSVLFKQEKEDILMVATDAHRLSFKKTNTGKKVSVQKPLLVSAKTIRALLTNKEKDDVDLFVLEKNNQVVFSQGETDLVGRLIEGEYPDYEKIMPQDFSSQASFEKSEMQAALKTASVFARENANIVKLSLRKNYIELSARGESGENSSQIEAKMTGDENEIAFNGRYLLELLSNIEEDEMVFEMTGPLNPGVFKIANDPSFVHLIMPIRVKDEELQA